MKIWTIQTKEVLKIIDETDGYLADFGKSTFLMKSPGCRRLYSFVLDSFNQVNHMDLNGLIFGFAGIDDDRIYEIQDFDQFRKVIANGYGAVASLWEHFLKQDSVVLELDYRKVFWDFNPLYIDINDFQYLMPPIMTLPPYTPNSADIIRQALREGVCNVSPLPSGILQAHLPSITWDCVDGIYDMFKV